MYCVHMGTNILCAVTAACLIFSHVYRIGVGMNMYLRELSIKCFEWSKRLATVYIIITYISVILYQKIANNTILTEKQTIALHTFGVDLFKMSSSIGTLTFYFYCHCELRDILRAN